MIKLNAIGHQGIEDFLNERTNPSAWWNPRFQSIVMRAHERYDPLVVLDSIFTLSGLTEVHKVSADGFTLFMTWTEFEMFASNAVWTAINNGTWEMSSCDDHDQLEENELCGGNGVLTLRRETSTLHPSGKVISVVYESESIFSASDKQRMGRAWVGTWFVDGLTLINEEGVPIPYEVISQRFEICKGRFGPRNGQYTVDMKTIDRSSLIPKDDGTSVMHGEIESNFYDLDGKHYSWRTKVLARVSNQNNGHMRWEECVLKLAADGTYVCEKNVRSLSNHDPEQNLVGFLKTTNAVISFFGQGQLAKIIYRQAGIPI